MYYLCCKDIEISEIYVGHTTNFYKRMQNHKTVCNNRKDKNIFYIFINLFVKMEDGIIGR